MTIEKLTGHYRTCLLNDGHDEAVRIIDAHEVGRAALVARAEAAEQKLSNMNRPLDNIERQRLYDLEAEAAALRLDNKNLQARVDATEARRVGAMAALDQVCAESAALRAELNEARAESDALRGDLRVTLDDLNRKILLLQRAKEHARASDETVAARNVQLSEARALLGQCARELQALGCGLPELLEAVDAAANPESPRAAAERDEDQAQRVSDEMFAHDLAAAERAVLDAVRRWVDGEVTSVAHIAAAEHALREVKS